MRGIHFKLYTHAHYNKTFKMKINLTTLYQSQQFGQTIFNSFLFPICIMIMNMISPLLFTD